VAPYVGPSLVGVAELLARGGRDDVYLGVGAPAARLERPSGRYVLHALSGGEGCGVAPGMMSPLVDRGVLAETATWEAMVVWLSEHWDRRFGEAFRERECLRLRFTGAPDAGIVATSLAETVDACRSARTAGGAITFEPVRAR
jgi:hypothetical protein